MCQFVSWVEKDKKVFYLTDKQLKTKKGEALIKYIGIEDIRGHGAIRKYYFGSEDKKGGKNKECDDFSTPKNFPKEIALSLLRGEFKSKYFDVPIEMLSEPAWIEYEKIKQRALAECWVEDERIEKPGLAKYEKIEKPALAKYEKIEKRTFYKLLKDPKNLNEEWKKFAKENK